MLDFLYWKVSNGHFKKNLDLFFLNLDIEGLQTVAPGEA